MVTLDHAQPIAAGIRVRHLFLFLIVAGSSYVYREPAPYDLAAVALALILFGAGTLRFPTGLGAPTMFLLIFMLANFLSGMYAPNLLDAVFFLSVTGYLVITFYLFAALIHEEPERTTQVIAWAWIVAALITALVAIAAYYRVLPDWKLYIINGRAKGMFKDPNVFGPFLVPAALFLLSMLGERIGRLWKAGMLAAAGILMFALLISYSRAAWLNFVLAVVIFFGVRVLLERRGAYRLRTIVASVVVAVFFMGVVGWAVSQPEVTEMFVKRARLIQRYDSERFGTQFQALMTMLANPLGIGPGQSRDFFERATHNVFLRVGVENGLFGLIGYLGFLAVTLWRATVFLLRQSDISHAFIASYAATIAILANSLVIDSLHWRHFWLLAAILWGVMLAHRWRAAPVAEAADAPEMG
jgi:O-antigen ligase